MENNIKIDGTNDSIWNHDGARANWNISTLSTIKNDLKTNCICSIILPSDNTSNIANNVVACLKYFIINFEDNFSYTTTDNTIELMRINNTESYKIDITN